MNRSSSHAVRGSKAIGRRNLPLLLLYARECVLAQFRPMLNANGVTEQQWRVVRALGEAGALEPRQIVARCGISSPSLAGVLSRMEDMGLVRRERIRHDLRRQLASLTAEGLALIARMAPQIETTYAAVEKRLGRERFAALHAALDDVIAIMGADA